jgi:hypothetical protein
MPNTKKTEETKYQPVIAGMIMQMIGDLDTVALDNKTSRNDIIRRACDFLLKNKKKFGLK